MAGIDRRMRRNQNICGMMMLQVMVVMPAQPVETR